MRAQTGIVLLISVLLILGLTAVFVIFRPHAQALPKEFDAFKASFQACAETSLLQVLRETEAHGGMPELAVLDRTKAEGRLALADEELLNDRLVYDDQTGTFLPLWTTLHTPCQSNCRISYAPPLRGSYDELTQTYDPSDVSVEARMARRMNSLIAQCLNETVDTQDYTVTSTNVSTQVILSPREVTAMVRFTGSVSQGEKTLRHLVTRVKERTYLQSLYEDALRLTVLEDTLAPVAQGVYQLILLESGLSQPFPPVYATEVSYTPRIWSAPDVEEALAQKLPFWLSLIHLPKEKTADSTQPYAYRLLTLPIGDERENPLGKRESLSVRLAGRPSLRFREGMLIMPQTLSPPGDNLMSRIIKGLLPIQVYEAHYRILLPLVLTLTREGESFRFAWRTGVWDGKPLTLDAQPSSESSIPPSAYCQLEGSTATVILKTPGGRPTQAALTFTCGDQTCSYAVTDGDTLTLPPCVNAQATFTPQEKDKTYAFENLTITSQTGIPLVLQPQPQKRLSVTLNVFFHPLLKKLTEDDALDGITQEGLAPAQELWKPRDDEKISLILILTRMDIPHVVVREYDETSLDQLEEGIPLKLYEGSYHLSLLGMINYTAKGDGVRIPEKKGCAGINIPLLEVCVFGEYTIPEFTLNTTLFTMLEKDIEIPPRARQLTIRLPVFDPLYIPESDRDIRDLNALTDLSEYLTDYPSLGVSSS